MPFDKEPFKIPRVKVPQIRLVVPPDTLGVNPYPWPVCDLEIPPDEPIPPQAYTLTARGRGLSISVFYGISLQDRTPSRRAAADSQTRISLQELSWIRAELSSVYTSGKGRS